MTALRPRRRQSIGGPVSARLSPQPGEVIDRSRPLPFRWDGRRYVGYDGDTIASALAAAGVRVFSRSFKYHRPRGILTASFVDPGCIVSVDDEPNVRAGARALVAGMDVRPQNAWPSLDFDVKAANGLVAPLLTSGFYYKTFIKPQRLWPAYEKVLGRFASGGRVSSDSVAGYYDKRYAHVDVLVAGAGPAGMSAALAAVETGARVMLVEEEQETGGSLRWSGPGHLGTLRELRAALAGSPVEVLVDSVVAGRYDDNWISVVQRSLPHVEERLVKVRAKVLVVAPGLIERPYVFAGNDLPGVMLGTAVRRLVNLYGVRPGSRAVALTANPEGDAAISDLRRAGVDVACVIDARKGDDVRRALGRGGVIAVELADGRRIDCDLLMTSVGWTAPTSLLNMAGDRPWYDASAARFRPSDDLPDTVLAAGGIVGDGTVEELLEHGRSVGAAAAGRASSGTGTPPPPLPVRPHPTLYQASTSGFVDFSEDVSVKDIADAAKEGYDSSELVKRYTTATMGPAQGKLETMNTVAALAAATGRSIEELGTTVWRPPYAPVSLGALAGRNFEPVRYSPLHSWHEAHDARPLVAGQWIRPDHYGDPAAEVRGVRERVGIIDVTPLGKLDLRGPDVPKLLNAVYVNKWSKLDVGAVRYGVMCAEDGVVMDDGVTGRLSAGRYLMTTTSTGAAAVWEHLEGWLQTEHPEWQVHITPLTTYYASINVAGPRSRDLVSRLVDEIDLSAEAFPFMRVRTATVAGVAECIVWRIGFTGELSFEIHVPASYGLHVWEALLEAGRDLGVGPFGVEAQRILRLEKGHLIVAQDTDGLTRAYDAGLHGLVKLDKPDFVGRPELVWQQQSGATTRLVGLQPVDGSIVPAEACQIVADGNQIIGRVTSSRMSPSLGRSVCLASIAAEAAEAGDRVTVLLDDGRRIEATVMPESAHVDPEGGRVRA
jgi:sarcosine oxidase, subunit alpha